MNLERAVRAVARKHGMFDAEAYFFVFDALPITQRMILAKRQPENDEFHVSGQELLDGIRQHARKQFGYMTSSLFEAWGLRSSEDFGRIVFHLVDAELMRKTDDDKLEDFKNGFDFKTAFEAEGMYDAEWTING